MSPWHSRCQDPGCYWFCQRPGCTEPGVHFLIRNGLHAYDCTLAASLARQAIEELRPGMAPDEVAVARRVLLKALDALEHEDRRPVIYRAESA